MKTKQLKRKTRPISQEELLRLEGEQIFNKYVSAKEAIKSFEKDLDKKKNDSVYNQLINWLKSNGKRELHDNSGKYKLSFVFNQGVASLNYAKNSARRITKDAENLLKSKNLYNKVTSIIIDPAKVQLLLKEGKITKEEYNSMFSSEEFIQKLEYKI